MPKETWIIAGALTVLLLLGLLGFNSWDKKQQLDRAQRELLAAQTSASKAQNENTDLRDKLTQAQGQIEELRKEKEAAVETHKSLEDEMRAALESKDVTISQLQGKLTVSILDRVLFDSGEADLKPEGTAVLVKIAAILAQHPNLKVHVVGHTDNVPIRATARSRFPSNWELSTARATAAVRFLSEKASVDPRRLGAVGYGEFRPVADNGTPEGRARNRRIAITILPEEIAGADTVSSPAPLSIPARSTNSPLDSLPQAPALGPDTPVTR